MGTGYIVQWEIICLADTSPWFHHQYQNGEESIQEKRTAKYVYITLPIFRLVLKIQRSSE